MITLYSATYWCKLRTQLFCYNGDKLEHIEDQTGQIIKTDRIKGQSDKNKKQVVINCTFPLIHWEDGSLLSQIDHNPSCSYYWRITDL